MDLSEPLGDQYALENITARIHDGRSTEFENLGLLYEMLLKKSLNQAQIQSKEKIYDPARSSVITPSTLGLTIRNLSALLSSTEDLNYTSLTATPGRHQGFLSRPGTSGSKQGGVLGQHGKIYALNLHCNKTPVTEFLQR
jgi:hypothetical protein